MTRRLPKQYTVEEMKAVLHALQNNQYHNFHENDAQGIVIALYKLGFKILKESTNERQTTRR